MKNCFKTTEHQYIFISPFTDYTRALDLPAHNKVKTPRKFPDNLTSCNFLQDYETVIGFLYIQGYYHKVFIC